MPFSTLVQRMASAALYGMWAVDPSTGEVRHFDGEAYAALRIADPVLAWKWAFSADEAQRLADKFRAN